MQLSFRQGIVRYETEQSPQLLSWTTMSHDAINLNIVDSPCIVTFAHYDANYLIEESQSVAQAWQGQFPDDTFWLYWDIDLATGALSRGWTAVSPIYTDGTPVNPENDLHWFDLTTNVMRVWNAARNSWVERIRVFAGEVTNGATVTAYEPGSQVDIAGSFQSGNIILGANNAPLKQQDGTFLTTATSLIVQNTTAANVQFDTVTIYAVASEDMPALSLVTFLPYKRVALASSNNSTTFVNGIVVETLSEDESGRVICNGVVTSDQFTFDSDDINRPLFCSPTGQVTLTPPTIGTLQVVGYVYSNDSIYLNIQTPVRLR